MRRIALAAAFLASCGGGPKPSVREACLASGKAFCARSQACELLNPATETVDTCLTEFMGPCCTGPGPGSCDEESRIDDQQLAECVSAIQAFACQSVAQGAIPAACM